MRLARGGAVDFGRCSRASDVLLDGPGYTRTYYLPPLPANATTILSAARKK